MKILKKYLDDNLVKRFIRSSFSSIVSFVLFIKKSSEELRLNVDYRALNAITIKNYYSLSLIQETLSRIYKIRIYTILNIIVIFDKLRITKSEKWKIVFRTRYNLYKSLIINFDLYEISFTFQNYINDVLHEYLNNFYTIYIDNILIYSENRKNYIKYIR